MREKPYNDVRTDFGRLCAGQINKHRRDERYTQALMEFDELCAYPSVRRVGVHGKRIYVGTHPIVMQCENKTYRNVGSFINCINVKAKSVTIESVGDIRHREENESHHPHVMCTGTPCFGGDIPMQMSVWFADGTLAHITLYSVMFLEVARMTNHYAHPDKWPTPTQKEIQEWNQRLNVTTLSFPQQNSTQLPSSSPALGLLGVMRALVSRS